MKRLIVLCCLCLFSPKIFSQRFGAGLFGTVMHHNFYDTGESPHHGFKSGFENGAGLNVFRIKEGRVNEDNLRMNSLEFNFYSQETDSIIVNGNDHYNSLADPVHFHGTQKSSYYFLTFNHTNFFKAKWNEFAYYLIGIHVGAIINKSKYDLPGFDPTQYYLDPSVHGELPARETGASVGIHAGFAYEFSKLFIHFQVKYDWEFFGFQEYLLGARTSAEIGISIPFQSN